MRKYFIFIFLAVVILVPFFFHPAKNAFLYASKPFLSVFQKIGQVFVGSPINFFSTINSISNLVDENARLEEKVRQYEVERVALLEKEKENVILKNQLSFIKENTDFSLIPAYVIGKAPTNFWQYLISNKGENDGIKVNQAVVFDGVLLGKIVEVNLTTAKVFLLESPNAAVPALAQDSRASGLVKGEIGYGLIFEDVSKNALLKQGENIITSGLGDEYPRGILIGKLDKVVSSPADLFQKASLKTLVDIAKIEMVFVMQRK